MHDRAALVKDLAKIASTLSVEVTRTFIIAHTEDLTPRQISGLVRDVSLAVKGEPTAAERHREERRRAHEASIEWVQTPDGEIGSVCSRQYGLVWVLLRRPDHLGEVPFSPRELKPAKRP